jgi:hypothetical protein
MNEHGAIWYEILRQYLKAADFNVKFGLHYKPTHRQDVAYFS